MNRLISPTSYYRTQPSDPITYSCMQRFAQEWLRDESRAREYLQFGMRSMQIKVGESLVDSIWRSGGIATVSLTMEEREDHALFNKELILSARIQPAIWMQEVIMMEVPHLEFFPADWVCVYCGMLNDGLTRRTCVGCGSSKDLKWRERA